MTRRPTNISDLSMMELFRMELDFQLKTMDETLVALEKTPNEKDKLDVLMRCAHSIKGAGRMVEVYAVVQLAHALEDCFVAAQKEKVKLKSDHIDIFLNTVDVLHYIAKQPDADLLKWADYNRKELDEILLRIRSIIEDDNGGYGIRATIAETAEEASNVDSEKVAKSVGDNRATIQVDTSRINKILGYAGESLVESHRFTQTRLTLSRQKRRHYQLVEQIDQLREMLDQVSLSDVVRSKLQQISSTAMVIRNDLADHFVQLDNYDRRNTILNERLYTEIVNTRMRPFSALMQGWARVVRDLGKQLDKEVRLEPSGMATLVDREVLERITVPLKHIIQNAVDHGIETPEDREKAGKNKIGTITLNVKQNAGQLHVVLQDDGRGVDFKKLRKKIVQRGLASEQEVNEFSQEKLLDFWFVPGFSTTDKVNEISGRGVGLDLVKDAVTQLNGSVHVSSVPGSGTRFDLFLPLTVSVMRVLVVQLAGELYGVPMGRIHRVLKTSLRSIKKDGNRYLVEWEGKTVVLNHGGYLFKMPHVKAHAVRHDVSLLIFRDGDEYFGWVIDAILAENELSLQKIDPILGKITGINAAAVRQDGALILITDVGDLISLMRHHSATQEIDKSIATILETSNKRRILLVDSVRSARERIKRLLLNEGYEVQEEAQGSECSIRLQQDQYDLAICALGERDNLVEFLLDNVRFHRMPIMFLIDGEKPFVNPRLPWRFVLRSDFQSAQFIALANRMME